MDGELKSALYYLLDGVDLNYFRHDDGPQIGGFVMILSPSKLVDIDCIVIFQMCV